MSVVFLTEYGEGIGLGHIIRCQALADEIKDAKILAYPDIDWIRNPPVFEPDIIIIIDSYLAKPSHYRYFSNLYSKVIAIDDYNRIDYGKCKVIQPDVFSGEDLFILRETFKNVHFKLRPQVEKIIVSLGGSDYRNILKEIIQMLKSLKKVEVTYFGSDNPVSKDDVPGIMASADIFISGFGQSMFELSYLGVPTIGIQIDIDQQRIAEYFVNAGISKHNKWNDIHLISNLQNQIETNYQSYTFRKDLSKRMKAIVDGNGKKRIIEKIYE
jgi:UDP-2,4-diacetamido-2,4,6-trideoxy-beta-L-altropyranose hydrolase